MWGMLVGGIVFGILADKYGRKNPLMIAIVTQTACSYTVCFISNYWWFLVFWFTLALASGGIGIISFVMCMEVRFSYKIISTYFLKIFINFN